MSAACEGCGAKGFRLTNRLCDGCYEASRVRTLDCLLADEKPRPVKRLWRRCRWSNS